MYWTTTRFTLDLRHPKVMGIVNVTPDSFSDGGRHQGVSASLAHCEQLVAEGADILDIGGESTRPGAQMPTVAEELARVLPVLRGALALGVPVSVDTSRPEVIQEALTLGVDIINDVRALRWPGALEQVAQHARCGVCLMHMVGEPGTMQVAPHYQDVVAEVAHFLSLRGQAVRDAGIADQRVVLDPGYGFGKSHDHNIALLAGQAQLLTLGRPLLIGWSRKGTLGYLTGKPVGERLAASVAAALAGVARGASMVRVHDVGATVDALKVWRAVSQDRPLNHMTGC